VPPQGGKAEAKQRKREQTCCPRKEEQSSVAPLQRERGWLTQVNYEERGEMCILKRRKIHKKEVTYGREGEETIFLLGERGGRFCTAKKKRLSKKSGSRFIPFNSTYSRKPRTKRDLLSVKKGFAEKKKKKPALKQMSLIGKERAPDGLYVPQQPECPTCRERQDIRLPEETGSLPDPRASFPSFSGKGEEREER